MKKGYALLSLLGVAVVVLSLVEISVSNMLSTGGIQLSKVQAQIAIYQRQNALLEEKIYTLSSLTHVAEEAQKLGYVPASKSTLVIANPQPLAIKP